MSLFSRIRSVVCLVAALVSTSAVVAEGPGVFHAMGEIAGEVDRTSVILQSRLSASAGLVDGDVPGAAGVARFEISASPDFAESRLTDWLTAEAAGDFIVKTKVHGLAPGTRYYYRLHYGPHRDGLQTGETCTFRTLQGADGADPVSFVVVTGMNYGAFHHGLMRRGVREAPYQGDDKALGYPALAAIRGMAPDFFVGTGDNVYYDSKDEFDASDEPGMRRKWHEQFAQPRFVELFRDVPTYWEKDDHDHRYNDCDRIGDRPPSSDLGIRVFREQVPVVDPADPDAKTYRTYRVNRHLQIWLVEGRDYRSPNKMPDGPEKTLWGAEQIAWLKRTLLESDATWKLLISPTPMVGPDDAYKTDNHTNHDGFRHEGRAFFDWVKANRLDEQGFRVLCGDRHWQYHSIDPTGIEEFSSGALVDVNSRIGRSPGDPESTDPGAEIQQLYTQTEASGGFLRVAIDSEGIAEFAFFDEHGAPQYQTVKQPTHLMDATAPVDIGGRRELFVDQTLIATMAGTALKLHQPVLAPAPTGDVGPIEYGTVIKDGERYRLYTRARHNSQKDGDAGEYTRYFESDDGHDWRAPDVGLIQVSGTDWGNVILHEAPYCHNFSPMLDVRPGVPADERFKALAGLGEEGLSAFASADGIHWRKLQEDPVFPPSVPWEHKHLFDSQNVSFWSESEGQYVCYFRSYDGYRRIARVTSSDYRTWTNPKLLDVNSEGEHLYTSQTHPYFRAPHIYVGLPTRYYPDRGSSTDILFMATRGDALYNRPFHEALIRPGLDPARWGNRSNYAALNVVPTGPAEMSIYTTPFRRFTLRTDGFVSVHAGAATGEMTTKVLQFDGQSLSVNYATSAGGSLRVEIQDADGKAIPGYALENCPRLVGDAIEQVVAWDGGTDVSGLRGQAVRLRFELADGDLYAIQFQ